MATLDLGTGYSFDGFTLDLAALLLAHPLQSHDGGTAELTFAKAAPASSQVILTGITTIDPLTGEWSGLLTDLVWRVDGVERFAFHSLAVPAAEFQDGLGTLSGQALLSLLLSGDDIVNANASTGWYLLGDGSDTFHGNIGDDYVVSGTGTNTIDGGEGFDTLDYSRTTATAGIIATSTTVTKADGTIDTNQNVERIIGTIWSDRFEGSQNQTARNEWLGGGGGDTFSGGASYDTVNYLSEGLMSGLLPQVGVSVNLSTGVATDRFGATDHLTEIDELRTTDEADTVTGATSGKTVFHLMSGDDVFSGLAADDWISSGAGNDMISGGAGYDVASYALNDSAPPTWSGLFGFTQGGIIVWLGAVSGQARVIDQYGGKDELTLVERIEGTSAADVFQFSSRKMDVVGLAGDDTFIANAGAAMALDYSVESQYGGTLGITADLVRGRIVDTFGFSDTVIGLISLIATDLADLVVGSDRAEWLDTGDGADTIAMLGGNDWVRSGAENDQCNGGSGFDTLDYSTATTLGTTGIAILLLGDASGRVEDAAMNFDSFDLFEAVVGTSANDTLTATDFAITFAGGRGDDHITANASADVVIDYALEQSLAGSTRGIIANLSDISRVIGTLNIDPHRVVDTFGDLDALTGVHIVNGTSGLDVFYAGTSSLFRGGAGNDIYVLDGQDTVIELANGGTDTIRSSASTTLSANVENLQLLGSARSGIGNTLNNTIDGTSGANLLSGKAGADILRGGSGADKFLFDTKAGPGQADRILDFTHGLDKLQFSKAFFSALGSGTTIKSDAFVVAASAQDAEDRLIYNHATGNLFYDFNGTGTGGSILVATLTTKPALSVTDIQLI